jgi:hypothetical protein
MNRVKFVTALAAGLISSNAFGGAVVPIDGGNSTLPRDSNYVSWIIDIGFDVNFSDNYYSRLRVNSSGSITLGDIFVYLGDNPVRIHPYSSANMVSDITYGNITYEGQSAFAVSWIDAANKAENSIARNSFQLILVDRSHETGLAGDFDFVFNYDTIQWSDGFYGNGSFVGYSFYGGYYVDPFGYLPDGMYGFFTDYSESYNQLFTLNSSQLPYNSFNSGVAGRYVFEVRNGVVTPQLPLLVPVPEPETWVMLLAGLGIVGVVTRRRQATA